MLNKKEIRPAATGTEIIAEVFRTNPHKDYITDKSKKQAFLNYLMMICLYLVNIAANYYIHILMNVLNVM